MTFPKSRGISFIIIQSASEGLEISQKYSWCYKPTTVLETRTTSSANNTKIVLCSFRYKLYPMFTSLAFFPSIANSSIKKENIRRLSKHPCLTPEGIQTNLYVQTYVLYMQKLIAKPNTFYDSHHFFLKTLQCHFILIIKGLPTYL